MRALRTVALAGAAAVALSGIAIGAASADPTFTPSSTDIVAVGSDTTQALFNKWSTDYVPTTGGKLASYDATGSALITTKNATSATNPCGNGTTTTVRPNGSGAGITELNKNIAADGLGHFCVDIGRSSRQVVSTDGAVSSVLVAQDGISYAVNSTTNAVANLTTTQLGDIYNCTVTKWNDPILGGASGDTIKPILPQGSSGTRQTFLQKIGVTTPGACVVNADGTQAIEENEGNNAVFGVGAADELVPFSIGSYISQVDKGTSTDVHGSLVLEPMTTTGRVPSIQQPVINPGTTNASINPNFPMIRGLFAVVRGNGGTIPVSLQGLLGTGSSTTGWVCTNATAAADIVSQGFLTAGAACGTIFHF